MRLWLFFVLPPVYDCKGEKKHEKEKNIIFDTSRKSNEAMIKSLEEFNFTDDFQSIKDLFYILKTRHQKL